MKNNNKVPLAILSCFLIAFIVQGILKLSGIFIFEKALDWEIFRIIDNTLWLRLIYYSIIVFIVMYCLSFAFTTKQYSNKWYHYVILIVFAFGITSLKLFTNYSLQLQIIYDVLTYVAVPLVVKFTSDINHRGFDIKNINSIIIIISLQILLYFCYLGLNYWSSMLSSVFITKQVTLQASTMFLIYFETYLGLILLMLSTNSIMKLKGGV